MSSHAWCSPCDDEPAEFHESQYLSIRSDADETRKIQWSETITPQMKQCACFPIDLSHVFGVLDVNFVAPPTRCH